MVYVRPGICQVDSQFCAFPSWRFDTVGQIEMMSRGLSAGGRIKVSLCMIHERKYHAGSPLNLFAGTTFGSRYRGPLPPRRDYRWKRILLTRFTGLIESPLGCYADNTAASIIEFRAAIGQQTPWLRIASNIS